MLIPSKNQTGLTLIELMISITLGLFVLAGLVYLTSATIRTNTQTLRATHLNQELRSAVQMMARDMQRGESWAKGAVPNIIFTHAYSLHLSKLTGTGITVTPTAPVTDFGVRPWLAKGMTVVALGSNPTCGSIAGVTRVDNADDTSPVTQFTMDSVACPSSTFPSDELGAGEWTILNPFSESFTINGADGDADGIVDSNNGADNWTDLDGDGTTDPCFVLTYDLDSDGQPDDNENYGYRFSSKEKSLQVGTTAATCTAGSAGWSNLTDENTIEISAMRLVLRNTERAAPNGLTVGIREIDIELAGRLETDLSVKRTVKETIRLRNDFVRS